MAVFSLRMELSTPWPLTCHSAHKLFRAQIWYLRVERNDGMLRQLFCRTHWHDWRYTVPGKTLIGRIPSWCRVILPLLPENVNEYRRYLFPLPLLPRHISRHGIANEWMEHLNCVATTIDTCDDTVASGRRPISSNGYILSHFTIFRLRQSICTWTFASYPITAA